ncbi:MAG: hypothetical protein AB2L14_30080 [Candidatus Xenobiia bacterium LiM19]
MKSFKGSMVLIAFLVSGILLSMIFFYGCGKDDDHNYTSGGGSSPSPNPSSSSSGPKETELATGRTNTYDLEAVGEYVYWTEKYTGGGVFRVKADGTSSSPETVATGLDNAFSLTLANGDTYVTLYNGVGSSKIVKKAASDTGTSASDYITGRTNTAWIVYNTRDGYLYWLEYTTTGGALYRAQAGSSANPTVDTVCNTFSNPYGICFDKNFTKAYIGEMAGSGSRLMSVSLAPNSTASQIYSGPETLYVTSTSYDDSTGYLYWCNYQSNGGVYRVKTVLPDGETATAEVVEEGLATAFDVQGPQVGNIYYSLNITRGSGGTIYYDLVSDLTKASVNALGSSTSATYPFRFETDGLNFYWTEYNNFNPQDLQAGGSSSCRVMKYKSN